MSTPSFTMSGMRKPTQIEAFYALYSIAAADGRGEALFGDSLDQALDFYQRTLIGDAYPIAHLEFPLLGEPCLDLLSVHGKVPLGAKFAVDAGYGRQAMFDWFAEVGASGCADHTSVGLELDLSRGQTQTVGVYLQQRQHMQLVAPFLESVGEPTRAQSYLETFERMPKGWPPSYVGLFPGREGTPMRIGGYMRGAEHARCVEDPTYLGSRFRQIGFMAFDADMLNRCAEFMRLAPAIDFQFDIMPDGSLGDTFGLSLSFNETKPREARECMQSGYGARLMRVLQGWGLADDRWKEIAGTTYAGHVGFEREDGTEGRFALCIRFNYAKVKFSSCEPQPAKFYLTCVAGELEG